MVVNVKTTALEGVLLIETPIYSDTRGRFAELFVQERYEQAGITQPFVQDNWSHSKQGVLRGLHFQRQYPQGKLVTVLSGCILDVVVDIDPNSPTFRTHIAIELEGLDAGQGAQQLWIPAGYAHGFCVRSAQASVFYKCTEVYRPEDEGGIIWSDPDLAIDWQCISPIVSDKDNQLTTLQMYLQEGKFA